VYLTQYSIPRHKYRLALSLPLHCRHQYQISSIALPFLLLQELP
jgi:hypothetical protein